MIIGSIIGILTLFLASNPLLKRIKSKQLRALLFHTHKWFGVLLFGIALLHMILTLKLINQRPISMYILGFIMIFGISIAVFSYLFREKLKSNWIVIHKTTSIVIMFCLLAHITIGIWSLHGYKETIHDIKIDDIDVTKLKSGKYIGECDAGYIFAKVKVIVTNGKISSIELLEHRTERGKPAEAIITQIVNQQKITVDSISGATNSSKVIEKAIYNALNTD